MCNLMFGGQMRRGGEGTRRDRRGGEEKGGAGEGEELLYIVIWTHRHNDIYKNPSTHLQDLQTPFHFIPHDPILYYTPQSCPPQFFCSPLSVSLSLLLYLSSIHLTPSSHYTLPLTSLPPIPLSPTCYLSFHSHILRLVTCLLQLQWLPPIQGNVSIYGWRQAQNCQCCPQCWGKAMTLSYLNEQREDSMKQGQCEICTKTEHSHHCILSLSK